jgi:hypothetical protein
MVSADITLERGRLDLIITKAGNMPLKFLY